MVTLLCHLPDWFVGFTNNPLAHGCAPARKNGLSALRFSRMGGSAGLEPAQDTASVSVLPRLTKRQGCSDSALSHPIGPSDDIKLTTLDIAGFNRPDRLVGMAGLEPALYRLKAGCFSN